MCLLGLINSSLYALQKPALIFENYSTKDGLSHSKIVDIVQDLDGFIWLATYGGLNRFDGYDFKVYNSDDNDPQSIRSGFIHNILCDSKNNIWACTDHGFELLNRDADNFIHVPILFEDSLRYDYEAFHIAEFKNTIYGSYSNSLLKYNEAERAFEEIMTLKSYSDNITFECWAMHPDDNGGIWIGGHGLNYYNPGYSSEVIQKILNQVKKLKPRIRDISIDKLGNLWICSFFGIHVFNLETGSFKEVFLNGLNKDIYASSILVDNMDRLWMGSIGGLFLYDFLTQKFECYKPVDNDNFSISSSDIYTLYQDKQHNLWVGHSDKGIDFVRSEKLTRFRYLRFIPGDSNSLGQGVVSTIFQASDKNIWIGINGTGVNRYNPSTGEILNFTYSKNYPRGIKTDGIIGIAEDTDGSIWMGTWGRGLFRYDIKSNSFFNYKASEQITEYPGSDNIFGIVLHGKDSLFMATHGAGLLILNKKTGIFSCLMPEVENDNSVISANLVSIMKDTKGKLWMSSYNGASSYDINNNKFNHYRADENSPTSLSNNIVWFMYEDSEGDFWLGTNDGLNALNEDRQTFKVYRESNGLPNNVVRGLVEDKLGKIWIATNNGISCFNKSDSTFTNYSTDDGLLDNSFGFYSTIQDRNGNLYFGGPNGITFFNPQQLVKNNYIPPVYITDLQISYRPVEIGVQGSPLTKDIIVTKELTFTHKQSTITFQFAALNYVNSFKNMYRYMLKGYDNEWNYLGDKRDITFTNLNPGRYTLSVKASNNDGIWNETPTEISLIIKPPWWKTWVFKIGMFVIIAVLVFTFFAVRIRLLNKQKHLLEVKVHERTQELSIANEQVNEINTLLEERQQQVEEQAEELRVSNDSLYETNTLLKDRQKEIEQQAERLDELNRTKDKFFSIIAHDLKNPLNTILGFSELLKLKFNSYPTEKAERMIDAVYSGSRQIFNLLENLLEWSRSQLGSIKFDPDKLDVHEISDSTEKLISHNALSKGLQIRNNVIRPTNAYADANMIDTVLRNLTTNAIKFSEKGEIIINAVVEDETVTVSVKDSGVGMDEETLNKLFKIGVSHSEKGTNGEDGTGLGLAICKEFVEKNGGKIWVESELGQGSTFCFTLPAYSDVKEHE